MAKTFRIQSVYNGSSWTIGTDDLPMPKEFPVSLEEIGQKFYGVSGIYFAWRQHSQVDIELQYVGKSKNIGERVYGKPGCKPYSSKRPELAGCLVNVVLFPEHEIHLAELFYIWKLRPRMNSETKKFYEGLPKPTSAMMFQTDDNEANFTGLEDDE